MSLARWANIVITAAAVAVPALDSANGQSAVASPPPPYPAPGRMVDVGGWRLHLNCTGDSTRSAPTVILEPGIGDFSVEWSLVQPGVAKFARVCSYDRAGDGWSDTGPDPRTFHQIVYELHTLLTNAGVRPPYILAGHSYGGWLIHEYRAEFPTEVAGMVFVDAGALDPWRMTPDRGLVRSSQLVTGRPIPPVKTFGPLREADVPRVAMNQIMSGTTRAAQTANEAPRDKLPPEAQAMRTWALGRWQHAAAANNPFEADELAALNARLAEKKEYPFGDMPLIVLTRGVAEESGQDAKAFEAEHRRDHAAVAHLSRMGKLIVAERSGHHIQIQEPELVITAIQEVLRAAASPRR